jgi:prolyl-tRNA synthetase
LEGSAAHIEKLLGEIQDNLYNEALERKISLTTIVNSYEEFKTLLDEKGGFFAAHWDGTAETEDKIKAETKATIRCIPLDDPEEDGVCMVTGKPSKRRVLFARAY